MASEAVQEAHQYHDIYSKHISPTAPSQFVYLADIYAAQNIIRLARLEYNGSYNPFPSGGNEKEIVSFRPKHAKSRFHYSCVNSGKLGRYRTVFRQKKFPGREGLSVPSTPAVLINITKMI